VSSRVLYTIGPSHYCEKARWALERLRISYTESRHPAILHWARIARFRSRTVPILKTPHGVLTDSTKILEHLDQWVDEPARLFPASDTNGDVKLLEDKFDRELGPQTRRLVYAYVLDRPDLFIDLMSVGVSRADLLVLKTTTPVLVRMMVRAFNLKDRARAISRTKERVLAVFDDVRLRLADGRPFLTGDRFTAADLAFASLASPVVAPPNYGQPFPPLSELPDNYTALVREMREHPAGAFAVKMFETQRLVAAPGVSGKES
jgi:glutathione S-transferase